MNRSMLVLFLAAAGSLAAPAAPEQEKLQADLREAFGPVVQEVRNLVANERAALDNLAGEALGSSKELLEEARSLGDTFKESDRAGLGSSLSKAAQTMAKRHRDSARSLASRALADQRTAVDNARAAASELTQAVRSLEDKYVSADGHDLLKALGL